MVGSRETWYSFTKVVGRVRGMLRGGYECFLPCVGSSSVPFGISGGAAASWAASSCKGCGEDLPVKFVFTACNGLVYAWLHALYQRYVNHLGRTLVVVARSCSFGVSCWMIIKQHFWVFGLVLYQQPISGLINLWWSKMKCCSFLALCIILKWFYKSFQFWNVSVTISDGTVMVTFHCKLFCRD